MVNQILAKLVTKYPGLSKQFLGLIAAQLATKVTEESGIDAAVAELDNAPIPITTLASEFQKEGDRRVTEAKKTFEKSNPKPGDPPKPVDPPAPPTDAPEGMKELLEGFKALQTQIAAIQTEKQQLTMKQIIAAKLKDVPGYLWEKRSLPTKEEEVEAFIADVQTDYQAYEKDLVEKGVKSLPKPGSGTPTNNGVTKASKEEIDSIVKDIM